ncbi:MAG TPA: cytochrome c3 family protein [Pirellulales bacterium]|nr:cytochrome c3 family protein [Pirellulales bacterium]
MVNRLLSIVLLVGLVVVCVALVFRLKSYPLAGNQQGYEPVQPIAFSHRLHAGELEIACLYCHNGAERTRHAGIPAASVCMNCHRLVTGDSKLTTREYLRALRTNQPPRPVVSAELQQLYDHLGLDEHHQPDPKKTRQRRAIPWVRVHRLPAYAGFDHRAHMHAGLKCQRCHGPVETMERVRQVEDLSMGWCVECHREPGLADSAGPNAQASTDCAVCHY